jgi:D-alanyl-D-alanine carboxypeptidase
MTRLIEAFEHLTRHTLDTTSDSPSIAVAVNIDHSGLRWRGGASRGEPLSDAAANTPFRIASITKIFVAAAIHRLIEERKLALNVPLSSAASKETSSVLSHGGYDPHAIQIAHLLSHTSGLYDHTFAPSYLAAIRSSPDRCWTPRQQIEVAASEGRAWGAPGEVYSYSDTGFVILGEIIEIATEQPLAAAVRKLLRLDDLALQGTWWERLEAPPPGAPRPASQILGDIDGMSVDPSFDLYGGGGLISTVDDLNRFLDALLAGHILGAEGLAGALATPAARGRADLPGWRTHSYLMATLPAGKYWGLGHSGFWSSIVVWVPCLRASIALTLNAGGDQARTAARQLLNGLSGAIKNEEL